MSDTVLGHKAKTPWHLWGVGVLSLLWNAIGAFDYFMTQTRNDAYMGRFTAEQLDFFYSFPVWMTAAWAIAVWGSVLGSILLLCKMKIALPVFVISWIGMIANSVYMYVIEDATAVTGFGAIIFSGVIFVIGFLLILYARAMSRRGVLG